MIMLTRRYGFRFSGLLVMLLAVSACSERQPAGTIDLRVDYRLSKAWLAEQSRQQDGVANTFQEGKGFTLSSTEVYLVAIPQDPTVMRIERELSWGDHQLHLYVRPGSKLSLYLRSYGTYQVSKLLGRVQLGKDPHQQLDLDLQFVAPKKEDAGLQVRPAAASEP